MRIVPVRLVDRSYQIKIGPGILEQLGEECLRVKLGRSCAIITDTHVGPRYGRTAQAVLQKAGFKPCIITVPAGEKAKSLRTVQSCYNVLAEQHLERRSFIVALGGGVVGDLAGFVAATYLRGIPFVQVPTTLLAQVDSSVGGKVGVNLPAGKNLVGSFYQPKLVLCDLKTLDTLPGREFRSGLAEVIKYGIIYDSGLFGLLEQQLAKVLKRDPGVMAKVVARCCAIKAAVVTQDEHEGGLRAILNFGHTIGHALEAISHYGKYLHGEAISIGQVGAARISSKILGLTGTEVARIEQLFEKSGLPTTVALPPRRREDLVSAMRLDKKVQAGEVRFVLCRKIGRVEYGIKVPADLLSEALNSLKPGLKWQP